MKSDNAKLEWQMYAYSRSCYAQMPASYWLGRRLWITPLTFLTAVSSLLSQNVTRQAPAGTGQSVPPSGHLQRGSASLHLFGPAVLAVDADGNLYAAVPDGVFKIDPTGGRTRIAGIERDWHYSGDGGPAIRAGLNPRGMALDAGGNLYLADTGNHRIRKLNLATGVITTVAGNGVRGFAGDGGPATSAQLDGPTGVAIDTKGDVYIADGTADGTNRIRKVAVATGVITTIAGNGWQGYSGDGGPAILAQFRFLGGMATDASDNLYIADNFNNRIRMVSAATGIVTTVAGNGVVGFAGDGGVGTNAELNNPLSVAVDHAGNLLIADSGNYRIRRLTGGTISTIGNGGVVYRDTQHGFPCALAVDAAGNVYIADSGFSPIRRVPANSGDAAAPALLQSHASGAGFKINVTYDNNTVPLAAQTAFNSVISTYESIFTTNITVNIDVTFGNTGLGESNTQQQFFSYSAWRSAMMANATANPGNTYAAAAAASLPVSAPIGNGNVVLNPANARALGLSANTAVDSTLTFSNSITFEYTGAATGGEADFMDVAAHELDEALGIGSALTGVADNGSLPTDFEAEDFFRYSAAGVRAITTNPSAVVYFSYDGGNTNVAQFNQSYSGQGDSGLDRNDWIYGNFGCPAATAYVQNAISCIGQAVGIGTPPETTVLRTLGYDSSHPQTITFNALPGVTFGVSPISLVATASSGLTVSFTSTTMTVCTVSGTTLTIIAAGGCSVTASQPGNATYSAATPVVQSFTVSKAAQTITFGALPNVNLGVAPFTISATATSGLAITFTSTTTSVCTVAGNTVTIHTTGSCSITASQGGNTNYNAATPVPQAFTVFAACTLSLTSSSFSAIAPGGSSTVGVTASSGTCTWTASSNTSWLTITAGSSGSGSGTVNYSIATNPAAARSGTMTIAGHTFTVNQFAAYPILDFNGDAKQDAFLYDPVAGTGYAGLSNGSGAFTYVYNGFTPGFDTIRFGNFTNSGFSGLLAYNSTSTLGYALLGTGSGTFTPVSLFWGPGFTKVAAGDLNADGLTDFVIYRPTDGTSYTAISNGDGTFHYQYSLVSIGFTHMAVADFNGDGKADVFFYRSSDGLAFLGIGNGTGGFTFSQIAPGAGYTFVEAGDINGDGKADLLFYASGNGAAAVGLSTGPGFTFTPYAYSPGFNIVKLFDFNGDGKADVALYDMNNTLGYLGIGNGTGNFTFGSLFWGAGMTAMDTLDLNGDGKIDIVIYNSANGASYTGISSGNPASPFIYQYAYWGNGKVLATAAAQP
jgi:sugar lactone lactonase YvrE